MSEPKFKVGEADKKIDLRSPEEIKKSRAEGFTEILKAKSLSPIEEQTNLVAEGQSLDGDSVATLVSSSSNSVGQDFPKCTLSNKELIERSREWITKLCNSEGKAWCLRVPPDVNRDPDFLFTELCDRLNNELPVQECDANADDLSTVRPDNNSEKTMTSKDHSRLKEGEEIDCYAASLPSLSEAWNSEEDKKRWELEPKEQVSNWKEEVSKKFDFVINMWKDPSNDMDGLHTLTTLKEDILEIVAAGNTEVSNTDWKAKYTKWIISAYGIGMTSTSNFSAEIEWWERSVINPLELQLREAKQWVSDLQTGMYVNCVYCGHRYGKVDNTPVSMADVLKQHIEQCPEHPMSKLKEELKKAKQEIEKLTKEVELRQENEERLRKGINLRD